MVARPAFASWRWSYKGEVDGNLLLEEFFAVGALDGGVRFFQSPSLPISHALRVPTVAREQTAWPVKILLLFRRLVEQLDRMHNLQRRSEFARAFT